MASKQKQAGVIFHYPAPLKEVADSASGLRPQKMLRAFQEQGFRVHLVAGYGAERVQTMLAVKERMAQGEPIAFCYSESSTLPTLLTEKHHLPLYPRLDFAFFAHLQKHQIPIGLFYRDAYWRFPEHRQALGPVKSAIVSAFHRYDLRCYKRYLKTIYLPSKQMAHHIPGIEGLQFTELPPAHDVNCKTSVAEDVNKPLRILYVGGLGANYRMHELFTAGAKFHGLSVTICTRPIEWKLHAAEYTSRLSCNVHVVHKHGEALDCLYQQSDVASLFVEPNEYRSFAAPFKLFEYIGHAKPIIASEGTWVGKFVHENGIGWTIPYRAEAFVNLVRYLDSHRSELYAKKARCQTLAKLHTWAARADQVAEDLMELP